jgi:hypothetical protein
MYNNLLYGTQHNLLWGLDPSWIKEFVSRYIRLLYQTDTLQQVHMNSEDTTTACLGKWIPSSGSTVCQCYYRKHVRIVYLLFIHTCCGAFGRCNTGIHWSEMRGIDNFKIRTRYRISRPIRRTFFLKNVT